MLFFYYGIPNFYTNVTQVARARCLSSTDTQGVVVEFPASDLARAAIFGDTLPSIVKHLLVVDAAGGTLIIPSNTVARVPAGAASVADVLIVDLNRERAAWWRDAGRHIANLQQRLEELHTRTVLFYGEKKDEVPEQLMALHFIKPDDCVLEIGGNIGRNSLTLAQILDDDTRLVVLESSPEYAHQLAVNRQVNGFRFAIESSALSAAPLVQSGWVTSATGAGRPVNTLTLEELRARYPLPFTALVADCEGALYQILRDFPTLLTGIRTVVLENDFHTVEHKQFVDAALQAHGLECVLRWPGPPHAPAACRSCFYEVWQLPSSSQSA